MPTVKQELGFLPTSVWHLPKSKYWTELISDSGDFATRRSKKAKYLPNLRYSEFNPSIAERVVKYWSKEGELIVDPFAGRSTRAVVSIALSRDYEGYEISRFAYEMLLSRINQKQGTLFGTWGKAKIWLADGCLMKFTGDSSADLIFTCPPYWNIEKYESSPEQLSDCKTYEEFLERLNIAMLNSYRVLKPDHFAIWVVGDFRKDGFKCLHKDMIELGLRNGLYLWDIIIEKLDSALTWAQIPKCFQHQYTSKEHQYILVFKKVARKEKGRGEGCSE